jgi:hypothetical protein
MRGRGDGMGYASVEKISGGYDGDMVFGWRKETDD